jgi:four helix bundle protein
MGSESRKSRSDFRVTHSKDSPLYTRTKAFAVRVVRLVDYLPRSRATDVMGQQLLRCATSVGANYRAARRARSNAEFCSKLGIVEEEADECLYWFDLLIETKKVRPNLLKDLQQEADEILAMIVASIRTARGRRQKAR